MRQKNLDLIAAISIVCLCVFTTLLSRHSPLLTSLLVILALPLVFFLPGYMLSEALFHGKARDTAQCLLLSLALSLVIDIIGGFILNMLPMGLQAKSWAVLLGFLIVVFALVVAFLRHRAAVPLHEKRRLRLRPYEYILLGLALIVATQALFYSTVGAKQQPHPGFTQFWLLPPAQGGKSCTLRLGVHSFESVTLSYRVIMTVNQKNVASWSFIELAPQQAWSQQVPIVPTTTSAVSIEARLYRLDKPQSVYQQVHLTLPTDMANYCSQTIGKLKHS